MNHEALQKVGLNANESKIYLTLLELGPSLAGKISEKSKINRRTVYDVLNSLMNSGLVSFIVKDSRKWFKATDPKVFLEILKDNQQALASILPLLQQKSEKSKKVHEATVFKGKKGIITILENLLEYKKIWTLGSHGTSKLILGPYFELHHKKRKQKKILSKFLLSERLKGSELVNSLPAKVRFFGKDYDSTITTAITDKKIAIIIWVEEPIGVVIESEEVCKSFKNYFEILWQVAKE